MNRRLRNGLLVVLLFSLIANVVLYAKLSGLLLKFHTLSNGEMIPEQDRSPDHSYKLFYGEWVITDVIETNLMEPEAVERAKDKRGEKYYFDEGKITIDDETFCELPQYSISMIPTTEWQRSAGRTFPIFDYSTIDSDSKKLSYKVPFYCYVRVYDSAHDRAIAFYVLDDNTLILDEGIQLKLERISHISNYEAVVGSP